MKEKRSRGVTIFCWLVISYSSLIMVWVLYVLIMFHLSPQHFQGIIYKFIRPFFFTLFPMAMAVLLLRLNDIARKIFIVSAIVLSLLNIYTSIGYARHQVPKFVEKFNKERVEQYKQKGQEPPPAYTSLALVVLSIFFNLPRIIWIIIYIIGLILFTRPKIKEQFR